MAALAAERDTKTGVGRELLLPQKGSTTIYQGALVVLDAAGYANPATAAASKTAVGRAEQTQTNSGADGSVFIRVRPGLYWWNNKGGDLVTIALVGLNCHIEDDNTVRATATATSPAGTVVAVDATRGVLVSTGLSLVDA